MGLSLRIDVDNPFGYATLFKKILNRMSLDYNLIPHWSKLGYLDNAIRLRDFLETNSVSATWFFRNITTPNKRDLEKFTAKSFDVALHAERTDTILNFKKETNQWKNAFGIQPLGFTKHGSGDLKLSRKHIMEYDNETFIEFGVKLGFKYFSGNGVDYQEGFEMRNNLVFVPSVFWLDNIELHHSETALQDVVRYSKDNPVVVLIHPIWWTINPEVRDRLDYLIEHRDFQLIKSQIEEFRETEDKLH